jgi:hypothetical protein
MHRMHGAFYTVAVLLTTNTISVPKITRSFLIAVCVYVWWMDTKTYRLKIASGTWLEGVFIFPSGDIVIRLQIGCFGKIEKSYEASSLLSVDLERHPSLYYCRWVAWRQLYSIL